MAQGKMMRATASANDRTFFWSLFILALALRLWGIWHVSATDEYNEVIEALRVCSGHLNFERWGKRFYLYILAGEYGIYFSAGWLLGVFSDPMDFATKIVRHMEPLFIMGRITSALAGAASVGVLYRVGERFFDRRTAVIASLLLTFTGFHLDLSQQAKVDATLGLMVLLSFYFILRILHGGESSHGVRRPPVKSVPRTVSGHRVPQMREGVLSAIQVCGQDADKADAVPCGRLRDFGWAGLFMGLAVQAKITAVVLFIPLGLTVFFLLRDGDRRVHRPLLGWFVPAFFAGFILGNPPVLLAPLKYIHDISGIGAVYTTAINEARSQEIGFIAYPLYFYRTMGPLVAVLAAAALVCSLLRPSRQKMVMLSFVIAFYLLMGASRFMVADYYMIPAVPFIYLLIGDLLTGGGGVPGRVSPGRVNNRGGFVSGYRVPQIRDQRRQQCRQRGLSSIHQVCGQADDKGDAVPCSRLPGRKLFGGRQAGGMVMAMVLPLVLIAPLVQVAEHELSLAGPGTRHLAKEWIEANIPSGSKILMDSGKSINSFAPLIAENEASLRRMLAHAEGNVAAGKIVNDIVDRNGLIYYELLLKTVPEKSYDITSTMFGLEVESIDDYLANGYQYFVISKSLKRARMEAYFTAKNPEVAAFYRSLDHDERIKLIKVIAPSKNSAGGTFYIYRLKHGPGIGGV